MKMIKRILSFVCFIFFLILLISGSFLTVLRVSGLRAVSVATDSMSDVYPAGTLIILKMTEPADIADGDIISFVADENLTVVTHRAVRNDTDAMMIYTKGDMNAQADSKGVPYQNVIGTAAAHFPYAGHAVLFLKNKKLISIMLAVSAAVIVLYLVTAVLKIIINMRRDRFEQTQKNK